MVDLCINLFNKLNRLKLKNQVIHGKIIWEYGGTGRRAGFKILSFRLKN